MIVHWPKSGLPEVVAVGSTTVIEYAHRIVFAPDVQSAYALQRGLGISCDLTGLRGLLRCNMR